MINKIRGIVNRVPVTAWYVVIIVFVITNYLSMRVHIIVQNAWIEVVKSNVTLNFILLFFMWGLASDQISKDKGWHTNGRKSWMLFFAGVVILVVIFSTVGGYKTIWGTL